MMMLCNFLYRCRSQTLTFNRICQTVSTTPRTTQLFLQLSTKTPTCASDSVNLKTSSDEEEPNSYLNIFHSFGFAQTHITTIVSKLPRALVTSQLKPKLDFLLSIIQSESDVINIVTKNPLILIRSLNNHLIPFYSMLKSVTGSDENAAAVIICNPYLLTFCISESFVRNIEFLQTLGVPQNQILKLLTRYGQAIGVKHDKFQKVVMKIKEMGFDLSSSYFLAAVNTLLFLTDLSWESRCEAYRSFGMSNNEILTMFKKQPYAMCYTEKKIRELLRFYIHTLGWSPTRLAHTPNVLVYSLKKRVIPRCSVVHVLESNQINYRRMLLTSILGMTDIKFLERFVNAFKDEVPEVMDAYQGKLTFDEYISSKMIMLCNLLYRCRSQTLTFNRICQTVSTTPRTTQLFLQLSTKTPTCASDSVNLKTFDKEEPNSYLNIFHSFGFAQTHITTIVSKKPRLIVTSQPDKYLKPKLDFLMSIIQSESDVINLVTKNPRILTRSLNNHLIPFYSIVKSVTGSDENAAAAIICNPFLLTCCISESFVQNIEFLQTFGVSQNQILKLVTKYGEAIGKKHEKFRDVVMKIKEMGFDLSSSYFLDAVNTMCFITYLTWESRWEAYRSIGLSRDEMLTMFKKQPKVMCYSVKRIKEMSGFFVHTLRWSPTRLSRTPNVLMYSLKKRVIPRCSVMQVLVSNEINYKRVMLNSILKVNDIKFLERFVTPYKTVVPDVIDAYQVSNGDHICTHLSRGLMVLFEAGQAGPPFLEQVGMSCEFKAYPGLGHSINKEEHRYLESWIKSRMQSSS